MPSRPASLARSQAAGGTGRRRVRSKPRPPRAARSGRRWSVRRALGLLVLLLLLLPPALLLVFRFVPVPITPLMVIRLAEGEGLAKDWVPLERIAPALRDAAIAAEDNLFCEHAGFDWGALRTVVDQALAGQRSRGASTISMQTAKNLFLWPDRSVVRKGLEAWLTPQIELIWDKRRILEVYLNVAELGPGIYGAEAAARAHFGAPAAALDAKEAALLAAILPNPRAWSASAPTDYVEGRAATIRKRVDQLGPMLACAHPT